jgi:hypothetical protein
MRRFALPSLAILVAMSALAACVGSGDDAADSETQAAATVADEGQPVPQLLDPAKLASYKGALPSVAFGVLTEIMNSPRTLWWDKETIRPAYQDTVGDGNIAPIGARFNSEGRPLIVPEGKKFFAEDGKTWSFPFAHTAGTDTSTNVVIVNFLHLPAKNGQTLPVVYRTISDRAALGGLGLHRWTWWYPKGTMVGEIIFMKDPSGGLVTSEIRTRERYLDGWATNVWRPFPTAASLSAAIKTQRPDWAAKPNLKAVVEHLENNATLTPLTRATPAWNNIITLSGAVDTLPDIGDPALVKDLLTKTPFVTAYKDTWKTNGTLRAFAASSKSTFSVVPDNYEASLLEVNEKSCAGCHDQASRLINDFEPRAVLYGDIWGSDQVFSFHPFDQSLIRGPTAGDNRAVRPALAPIVVRFDPAKHSPADYKEIAPR